MLGCFASETGPEFPARPAGTICHTCSRVHTSPGCAQKGEESTLQVKLAALRDLLDEGGGGEGAQVAPSVLVRHLGGNTDSRGRWLSLGCVRHIQVEMLSGHMQI